MIPKPYRSKWCAAAHYLLMWIKAGAEVYVVAAEGVQPADALVFVAAHDARTWLRENGFEPCDSASKN